MTSIDRLLALLSLAEYEARKHAKPHLAKFVRGYVHEVVGGNYIPFLTNLTMEGW